MHQKQLNQINHFLALDLSLKYVTFKKSALTLTVQNITREGVIQCGGVITLNSIKAFNPALQSLTESFKRSRSLYTIMQCYTICMIAKVVFNKDHFHLKNSEKDLLARLKLRSYENNTISDQCFYNRLGGLFFNPKLNNLK